jgi:hypothetical protein
MPLKPLVSTLAMAAVAATLSTGAVFAADQDVIDAIIADLSGQNFAKIEIKHSATRIKVEAYGENLKVERVYDADGTLREEEISTPEGKTETEYDAQGNITRQEVGEPDDDDFDDDDDDDHDDDDDDDHDDDEDDHDDDDEDDDDEDDDEDDDDDDDDYDDD